MSMIRGLIGRYAGRAAAARRDRSAGRPVAGRPGRAGRTGRTQDEAIGRGVRSLLRRLR